MRTQTRNPTARPPTTPATPPQRRDEAPLVVRGAFSPSTIDEAARTVELTWTTGAGVRRFDWGRGRYYIERLRVDEDSVDLARLQNGAPLLAQHNAYSLTGQIGVVERVWISGGEGHAVVRFSRRAEVESIWRDVVDGIIRNVSVGYSQDRVEDTEETVDGTPVREVTRWTPQELSLVSIPADAGAQVRSGEQTEPAHEGAAMDPENENENENENTPANEVRTPPTPAPTPTPAPAPAPQLDERAVQQAADRAVAAERQRAREIREIATSVGLDATVAERLVNDGVTLDEARAAVIRELAQRDERHGVITVGGNDARRTGDFVRHATDGIAHRVGSADRPEHEEARALATRSPLYIAEQLLRMGGVNTNVMTPAQIAQRAMQTSDFVHIIHDVSDRSLRRGYESEVRTFAPIFRQASASNFKNIERTLLSDVPALLQINELGEYQEATFGESKEVYAVLKYGRRVGFSWEMMINERYDAIGRVPQMFGNAAARLENDTVWKAVTGNDTTGGAMPNMADGKPLYGDDATTLGAAGANEVALALDVAALAVARKYFRLRKTENNQNMNLSPVWLVVGADLETDAERLLQVLPEYQTGSRQNTMSAQYRNSLSLAVESRIPANHWYMFASPMSVDTCEYAYLEGHERPVITRTEDENFLVDKIDMKIRHVVGAGALDRRGLFRSVGA